MFEMIAVYLGIILMSGIFVVGCLTAIGSLVECVRFFFGGNKNE